MLMFTKRDPAGKSESRMFVEFAQTRGCVNGCVRVTGITGGQCHWRTRRLTQHRTRQMYAHTKVMK